MATPVRSARARNNVAKTAHLTAWARTLGRLTGGRDRANRDYLADRFLLPFQRWFIRAPHLGRWLFERLTPGGFGYFNARTCYFDEVLLQEAAAGLEQLVLLGAGFDSRPIRFARELARVRVFEVDVPQVLEVRRERLQGVTGAAVPVAVPIDFERDELIPTLAALGYERSARTLFLWEGVTYYLSPDSVEAVFSGIGTGSGAGSSVLFDYVTQAFFEGDHSGHGAWQLAAAWRRLGHVNRSGIADVSRLVESHGFRVRTELTPAQLEERYLQTFPGPNVRAWGPMRIAHVERI